MKFEWVVSSVVERLVYTEDVGGSKPSPPTRIWAEGRLLLPRLQLLKQCRQNETEADY